MKMISINSSGFLPITAGFCLFVQGLLPTTASADITAVLSDNGSGGTLITFQSGTGNISNPGSVNVLDYDWANTGNEFGALATYSPDPAPTGSLGGASLTASVGNPSGFFDGLHPNDPGLRIFFSGSPADGAAVSTMNGATLNFPVDQAPFSVTQNLAGVTAQPIAGSVDIGTITFGAIIPEPSTVLPLFFLVIFSVASYRRRSSKCSQG